MRIQAIFAKLISASLYLLVSFLTGVRPKFPSELSFSPEKKVYFANHASHGDFVLVWISLPEHWRKVARPVAGADYWLKGKMRSFVIKHVFNGLLIMRNGNNPLAITEQMSQALQDEQSLIIFPEGTRNTDDDTLLLPFKSGIYHLARNNPDVEFVPIWINNINRVLPKGRIIPVPMICDVNIGTPLSLLPNESKDDFLLRARHAMLALAPVAKREAHRQSLITKKSESHHE